MNLALSIFKVYLKTFVGITPVKYPINLWALYIIFILIYVIIGTLKAAMLVAAGQSVLFVPIALLIILATMAMFSWKWAIAYTLISVAMDTVFIGLLYSYGPIDHMSVVSTILEVLASARSAYLIHKLG